jgi:hypothetical protein
LNPRAECPDHGCREELLGMLSEIEKNQVTHRSLMAWIGVPIGVISIILGLVMSIVTIYASGITEKFMVTKNRNDQQDSRLMNIDLRTTKTDGEIALLNERFFSIEKKFDQIIVKLERLDQRK